MGGKGRSETSAEVLARLREERGERQPPSGATLRSRTLMYDNKRVGSRRAAQRTAPGQTSVGDSAKAHVVLTSHSAPT